MKNPTAAAIASGNSLIHFPVSKIKELHTFRTLHHLVEFTLNPFQKPIPATLSTFITTI